jgi:hypothetical protein
MRYKSVYLSIKAKLLAAFYVGQGIVAYVLRPGN